jgi:hypothetical protein
VRRLDPAELAVVEMLIREAEDTITDMTVVLSLDARPVSDIRAARDWLRGVRDAGCIVGVPP